MLRSPSGPSRRSSPAAPYYAVFATEGGEMPPWKLARRDPALPRRSAAVVVGLAAEAGIDDLAGGLVLGAALFVGFPLVLWVGAILHEGTPSGLRCSTAATGC